MTFNWNRWIRVYEHIVDDPALDYKDLSTGTNLSDATERFQHISAEIQSRSPPHLRRPELRDIGEWKTGGLWIDDHLESNDHRDIKEATAAAFTSNQGDAQRIRELVELTGVRVPVASSILTVFDPTQFAVIDFRVLKALAAAKPHLADPRQYKDFSEYARWLLNYETDPEVYDSFLSEVRGISNSTPHSPREIDMALWIYDRDNS